MLSSVEDGVAANIVLSSPGFADGEAIPGKHSCYGKDISPPISWSGTPSGAKSLLLVSFETDASGKGFDGDRFHWLLYDMPPDATELPEAIRSADAQNVGGTYGTNDFKRLGWRGPCPPFGPGSIHSYFFKIYALDRELGLAEGATKLELIRAMNGHVLGHGQLVGTYQVKW